jgi:hypothetical protein
MTEVKQLPRALDRGDPHAAARLLPLVYDELRRPPAARLAAEPPGNTVWPTALVHEAYLRPVGPPGGLSVAEEAQTLGMSRRTSAVRTKPSPGL